MSEAGQVALDRTPERRAPVEDAVSVEELATFVREELGRPPSRPGLWTLVMPLPHRFDAVALLGALRGVDAFYFRTTSAAGASERLGLGAARRLTPTGADRFREARRAIAGWSAETTTVRHPRLTEGEPSLRAFVGFAFTPGAADREPWEPFGDALAMLPRWTMVQGPRGGTLELNLDRAEDGRALVETIVAELKELFSASRPQAQARGTLTVDHEPTEFHRARVEAALERIAAGALAKVVVARRSAIGCDRDLDPTHTLLALLGRGEEGAVYFVRRAGSVFLGVTPERLLSLRDRALETVALAGTAAVGEGDKLQASLKDQQEHQFVVTSIEETLRPLSSSVRVASGPALVQAGSVVHLKTRISATLRAEVDALQVAEALHPTPAVAGTPKDAATTWIARNEPERGWYSSPLGWVDARGDAELFVALRGGVIRGARAWAFSGGGIVEGSEPDQELAEAALKMGGFLRALGVT